MVKGVTDTATAIVESITGAASSAAEQVHSEL